MKQDEIQQRLSELPGWIHEDNQLNKTFSFPNYMDGIDFVNRVAKAAEETNHHPDMWVGYRKVKVSCTTHDTGGITEKDWDLIRRIEALQHPPRSRDDE